jgi:hypothetical protein
VCWPWLIRLLSPAADEPMIAPGQLESLCRRLVERGWWVTAAEKTPQTVIVGFNFMPYASPTWLKAFEAPHHLANVEGLEVMIETWKAGVRHDLENGGASALVRQMVAEHGVGAVPGGGLCPRKLIRIPTARWRAWPMPSAR